MIETILFFVIVIGILWNKMKRPKNFPPGPVPLPMIGNLLSIDHSNPQSSWETLRHKYGDIVGLIVPNYHSAVVVNGWEANKEALLNGNFQGRPDACLIRDRFNGKNYGIFFTDGNDWKTQRRFALHHFRNLGFGRTNHASVILEEAQSLGDEIESLDGSPITVEDMVAVSAINIVWCLIGGKRFQRTDKNLHKLVDYVKEMLHSIKVIGSPAVFFPFIRYLFPELSGYNGVVNGTKGVLQFIKAAIEDKRISRSGKEDDANDFISIYLSEIAKESKEDLDSSFSMEMLEGICTDLLSAGTDTTSSVVSFAVLFLCLKDGVQDKIYAEILNTIGKDRCPSYEDKANLVYTEAFLSECLRFRPPVPTIAPHSATSNSTLGGYDIPKDTLIIMNIKSIFYDRKYWGDPETFRPERFITDDGKLRRDERLISFGKGKRTCLGEALGKMATFLIFVTLVQRFSFKFREGEVPENTEGTPDFTLAPPYYRVIATPRKNINSFL